MVAPDHWGSYLSPTRMAYHVARRSALCMAPAVYCLHWRNRPTGAAAPRRTWRPSSELEFERRIYPLDPRDITEEELAVVFAMTSRRPEPFDQIRDIVTAEKAADFHERWVLGYGHASVAEHAVIHMAVENVSRLACDTLEDNRLASYTEKSSRYQVLDQGAYYTPAELEGEPGLRDLYTAACDRLFLLYGRLVEEMQQHLRSVRKQAERRRPAARTGCASGARPSIAAASCSPQPP